MDCLPCHRVGEFRVVPCQAFGYPAFNLAFDATDLLLVTDAVENCFKMFTVQDGGVTFKHTCFGWGYPPHCIGGIAFDRLNNRFLLSDTGNSKLFVVQLDHKLTVCSIYSVRDAGVQFRTPRGIAVDTFRGHVIIADCLNHRLVFLSQNDLKFLFEVNNDGYKKKSRFEYPKSIAVDEERALLYIIEAKNPGIKVYSAINGSFLRALGNHDVDTFLNIHPNAICIDNQGRVIIWDYLYDALRAFSSDGSELDAFATPGKTVDYLSFNPQSGEIVFNVVNEVFVIPANRWLPGTFAWEVKRHACAPKRIRVLIETLVTLREIALHSALSLIPNELLFVIFSFLS